jgi:putative antibiotic resistance-related regulatory protein
MKLTKAEEQIMKILWTIREGTVQDILQGFETGKPARTTIATVLSVLETKGFVEHLSKGRINFYKATVAKEDYSKKQLSNFVKDYFNGSYSSMFSFFAKETDLTIEEMDKIIKETRQTSENEESK